jgi:hypothetical protein
MQNAEEPFYASEAYSTYGEASDKTSSDKVLRQKPIRKVGFAGI